MPIYTVTYCTMDQEAGANPFWHTCILLSRYDEKTQKIEVVDNWGFYGLPTTMEDSIFRKVKLLFRLDVDITGNHGLLRHEDMRYLDLGRGLNGVTFEISEDKFKELEKRCLQMVEEQNQAINEIVKPLNLPAKAPEKTRIYPYENLSNHIFALENARAKEEKRPSRLKPFQATIYNDKANTCKVQVLKLLAGILKPEQIKRLAGKHYALSRFSGKMEKMFLHSSGPMQEHKKRSGEIVYFRDGSDRNVKLHWTLPPQEVETLSGEVRQFFKINDDHCEEVKKIVRQLQCIEWLFINANLDKKYLPQREKLLNWVRELYEAFAIVEPKHASTPKHSLINTFMWMFSQPLQPRDIDEANLLDKMSDAKELLNNLYMAVIDNWEMPSSSDAKVVPDEKATVVSEEEDEDLEALATVLSQDKKKELCKILGRHYLTPEKEVEQDNDNVPAKTMVLGK